MGKYPASKLLNAYSDWHLENCGKLAFMSDADIFLVSIPYIYRLWYEVRDIDGELKPVAVIDIKSLKEKEPTKSSKAVYDWLVSKGMPVYIVYTDMSFKNFSVVQYPNEDAKFLVESEYINFIQTLTLNNE